MDSIKYVYYPDTGTQYRLDEGHQLSIGRALDNHIVADDVSVSRHHALVGLKNGKVYIKDLHSTNGTVVNNEWIKSFYEYHIAEEFRVGNVVFKIVRESAMVKRNLHGGASPGDTVITPATL